MTTVQATLLADFSPGDESSEFSEFSSVDDRLYFDVNEDQLWQTDGTPTGTQLLAEVDRIGETISWPSQDLVLFKVRDAQGLSLWRTDGTTEGTFPLLPNLAESTVAAGNTDGLGYLQMDNALYRSDGTVSGTQLIHENVQLDTIVATEDAIYFQAVGEQETNSIRRWTDSGGEAVQLTLSPRDGIKNADFRNWTPAGNRVFFSYETSESIEGGPSRLYRTFLFQLMSDSTMPELVAELDGRMGETESVNGNLLFGFVRRDLPPSVWTSNGTAQGTIPIVERTHYSSHLDTSGAFFVNDYFVFPLQHTGLFRTDGTLEGTTQLPGRGYLGVGVQLIGTHAGEYFLKSTESDHCGCEHVYVTATDGESMRSAGSVGWGEVAVEDDGFVVTQYYRPEHRNELRQVSISVPPAIRDTVRGVTFPHSNTSMGVFANSGQVWYYQTYVPYRIDADGDRISRYGRTDPSASGLPDRTIDPFPAPLLSGNQSWFIETVGMTRKGKPYSAPLFLANRSQLYVFDGGDTPRTVVELENIERLEFIYDEFGLYFLNSNADAGEEIWFSDGTSSAPIVADIFPGPLSSEPELLNWNGAVFAIATTPNEGRELFAMTANVESKLPQSADLTDDGVVDFADLFILSTNYGKTDQLLAQGDIDGDRRVSFADFLLLADQYTELAS